MKCKCLSNCANPHNTEQGCVCCKPNQQVLVTQPAVSTINLGSINNYSEISEPESDPEIDSSSESESSESDLENSCENTRYTSA